MKLNFWQWIGVLLLVVGLVWLGWRELGSKSDADAAPPTSQKSG